MTAYPKFVDLFAWLTVSLAGAVVVVALAGVMAVLIASSAQPQTDAEGAEATFYWQPRRGAIMPFIYCVVLATGIGYFGYSMTGRSLDRQISNVEPAGRDEPPPR